MADPGRLRELLVPDARLLVRPADSPGRTTRWSAVLVRSPDDREWISLDTTVPNRLIRRALEARALPEFAGWSLERSEWTHGDSRLDFLLGRDPPAPDGPSRMAVEVKSVSLVNDDGVALFPDAVTARGARHLDHLANLARTPGWEAAVLFVLQRAGASEIRAAAHLDPHFAERLEEARGAGVRILGRRCRVTPRAVTLDAPVPAGASDPGKPFGGVERL